MKGRVIKSTGSWITVRRDDGSRLECKLKGQFKIHGKKSTNPLAVGDWVDYIIGDRQDVGLIVKIYERNNYIIRKATNLSKVYHVIASNIDQAILIVTIAYPRTHTAFIDRFLTTCEAYHIPAMLVINKTDLYNEEQSARMQIMKELYEAVGYPCLEVSATGGDGLDGLREVMKDKLSLFSGHSGVGKSTLLNALEPGLQLRTATISSYHEKGRHTTTFAEMHELAFGAFVIDTPGIREFGLSDFRREEVAERFPEFRALMYECQFSNCTHIHEPRCAVKAALEKGAISQSRYRNYLAIVNDEALEEFDWI